MAERARQVDGRERVGVRFPPGPPQKEITWHR